MPLLAYEFLVFYIFFVSVVQTILLLSFLRKR